MLGWVRLVYVGVMFKDRKTEGQKDRKTERQKDRKTERQLGYVKLSYFGLG